MGKLILETIQDYKLNSANEAFLTLQKDPTNTQALEALRSNNPPLYDLYRYAKAVDAKDIKVLEELASSSTPLVADISQYSKQVLASKGSDSAYYKGMSLVEDAYLALKAGKPNEAKQKLDMIDARSPVASIADLMKHYTIKGQ